MEIPDLFCLEGFHHLPVGDGDFFKLIAFFGVFESLVEGDGGISGTKDHLFVASLSSYTLRVQNELGADAFALDLVVYGNLTHLDGFFGDGS